MEIVGVVVDAIGVADCISGMKPLLEFSHDLFHRGVQDPVGADPGFHQLVVHLA